MTKGNILQKTKIAFSKIKDKIYITDINQSVWSFKFKEI